MGRKRYLSALGLASAVVCTFLCAWTRSFNVIAIDMKTTFNLTQTEVEFLASCSAGATFFLGVSGFLVDFCGYKVCYVISAVLVTSSSLLLSVSMARVEFTRRWLWLVGLLSFVFNCGCFLIMILCNTIAMRRYSRRHTGKLMGGFAASGSLGKIYYVSVYSIIFAKHGGLQSFYLALPIPFVIGCALCVFLFASGEHGLDPRGEETCLHEKSRNKEMEAMIKPDGEKSQQPDKNSILPKQTREYHKDPAWTGDEPTTFSRMQILSSASFQLGTFAAALQQGSMAAFINNATGITRAVGVEHAHTVVYLLSVGFVVSQIVFGLLLDFFGTVLGAAMLCLVNYASFSIAMIVCLLWLDSTSVFLVAAIVSVGTASSIPTVKGMFRLSFGSQQYPFMNGYLGVFVGIMVVVVQLTFGLLYDKTHGESKSTETFCKECLFWPFVALLSTSVASAILQTIDIIYFARSKN